MSGSTSGAIILGNYRNYFTTTVLFSRHPSFPSYLPFDSDSPLSYMNPKPKKCEEAADLGKGMQGFAQISARRFYSSENSALLCYRNMQAVPKSHELNNGWTLMNSGTGTLWRGLYTAMKNSNAETRP